MGSGAQFANTMTAHAVHFPQFSPDCPLFVLDRPALPIRFTLARSLDLIQRGINGSSSGCAGYNRCIHCLNGNGITGIMPDDASQGAQRNRV
jgi:hypothetical protein